MQPDYKRVQRRQGISEDLIESFGKGLQKFNNLKKLSGRNQKMKNDDLFQGVWVKHGHAHSDFDSERDGDPWDEYNKVDRFTSLETKLAKKLNQFPHIDLHSRIPYLNDKQGKKDRKKEDPQQLLYKKVAKEHRKQMSIIHNCNQIKMSDEVKIFQRYLRLNKKLAFSKNWDK